MTFFQLLKRSLDFRESKGMNTISYMFQQQVGKTITNNKGRKENLDMDSWKIGSMVPNPNCMKGVIESCNPKISEKFKKDRKTLTIVRKTDRQKESKPERQKKRY